MIDSLNVTRRKKMNLNAKNYDLLVPIFRSGKFVYKKTNISDIRQQTLSQLKLLHPTIKRFVNPHEYPVGLAENLYNRKTQFALKEKGL
jgi:nicotinate phosphoribosyltransferase